MSVQHNQFVDPAGVVPPYTWPINHKPDGESQFGKMRTVQRTAPTAGHGVIRQQQDEGALVLHFQGTALTKAQHQAFIQWWALCASRTVYFTDFSGEAYEVLITQYMPKRVGVAKNPRDPTGAPYWQYDYDIEMEVITILSGSWLPVNA